MAARNAANKKETKKLTKKELQELARQEQLKKEEEEKKRLEEEEKKRIEQEKIQKALEEKLAEEERERLKEEEADLKSWGIQLNGTSSINEKKIKDKEDWSKYIQCNPKPDPNFESDLTTYITQYNEETKFRDMDVKEVIEGCQATEDIIYDTEEIMMKALADDNINKVKWCKNYIETMRNISSKKLDEATHYIIGNSDILYDQKLLELSKSKDGLNKQIKLSDPQIMQKLETMIPHKFKDIRYAIWLNPSPKSIRHKPVDFGEVNIQVEVPRPLLIGALIMRVIWTSYDPYVTDTYSKDIVVGGTLDIACYNHPAIPKKVKNWTLKNEFEANDPPTKLQYPSLDSGATSFQNAPTFKVIYTLPHYVYLTHNDKIRVAAYTPKTGWSSDHIEDIKYDYEKKELTFYTLRMAPVALIQERAVDFPYTSWKLRCIQDQKAILDIQGKRQNLRFEIGPGYVMLRNKNDPEVAHLVNQKMQPGVILNELCKCGINLMPLAEDANTLNICRKTLEAEIKAINDISLAIRSFCIKSSRWNMSLPGEQILVRIRENLEYDEEYAEDQEKDWKSIVWWPNKCACIKARDSHEMLNDKFIDGTVTHSTLELLLKKHELTNIEALERFRDVKYIYFIDTVKRFLKLIHILTFTVG